MAVGNIFSAGIFFSACAWPLVFDLAPAGWIARARDVAPRGRTPSMAPVELGTERFVGRRVTQIKNRFKRRSKTRWANVTLEKREAARRIPLFPKAMYNEMTCVLVIAFLPKGIRNQHPGLAAISPSASPSVRNLLEALWSFLPKGSGSPSCSRAGRRRHVFCARLFPVSGRGRWRWPSRQRRGDWAVRPWADERLDRAAAAALAAQPPLQRRC